jgi:pyrroline-5-carboxylate reductase
MSSLSEKKIAFVGSGIIAGVFMERLLKAGATTPDRILGTDVRAERLAELKREYGIQVSTENVDGVRFGDIVFLAVPPNIVLKLLADLRSAFREDQLIISLAAAVPVAAMEEALGKALAVLRVIPNTPSLVGAGMNPYCLGQSVRREQVVLLDELLNLFGETIRVDERLMNIATALTAVGPTYIFPVIKALAEAAAAHGMPKAQAQSAAAQTVLGAARLVLETGRTPDELKLMIGTRTIKEEATIPLFTEAVELALAKISESQQKLTARPQAQATV